MVHLGSGLFMFSFSLSSEQPLQFTRAGALATELITRNAFVTTCEVVQAFLVSGDFLLAIFLLSSFFQRAQFNLSSSHFCSENKHNSYM